MPHGQLDSEAVAFVMKTLRATAIVEYAVPNHCQIPVSPFGVEKHVLIDGEEWKPLLAWGRSDGTPVENSTKKKPPGFEARVMLTKLQWVKARANGKKRRERIRRRLAKKTIG